jgi:hypothetical protein
LASHEPGFESHRAYLGHLRSSYTGSRTSCAKHSSVGSSIASGMAAAITTGHPTSNWRDGTQGWGRHPSTWGYTRYWTLNNRCRQVIHKWRFESEMTILSCFLNREGQYLKWTFYCKNWPCDIVIKYSLNSHFFLDFFFVVSYSQCNVLTGRHCALEIIWPVISRYLSYCVI